MLKCPAPLAFVALVSWILVASALPLEARNRIALEVPDLEGGWLGVNGEPALILHEGGQGRRGEETFLWRRFGKSRLRLKGEEQTRRPRIERGAEGELIVHWKTGTVRYVKAPESFPVAPPELEGAAKKRGKRWTHPRKYFSCELPRGWSVAGLEDGVMYLNPGLTRDDTLDAIPFVGWGVLEGDELHRTPSELIKKNEREWLEALAEEGLRLKRARKPPVRVLVGGVPGAQQEWVGSANGKEVHMWMGGLVKGEAFLFTGVVAVGSRVNEFTSRAKDLFLSMVPTPPKRNRALERALVGRRIASTQFVGESRPIPDSTGWSYEFKADGSVRYFWYLSGGLGYDTTLSGSSTEWGTYQVYGSDVFLFLESGQKVGELIIEAARPVAIELDGRRFSL